ncbi:hypothetical protein [Streptomyces caatingaensis]|uniref:hypothetical protein n=1 Tax=Streptomyces caatingaensis TaxID=1678637 RepID=UPI000672717A|nr:hypothetical protein [Streptomyces caatingaensis]
MADGQVVDVFPTFQAFATDAVSRALFPGSLGDERLAEVRNLFREVSETDEGVGIAAALMLLRGANGGRRGRKAVRELCDKGSDDVFLLSPLLAAGAPPPHPGAAGGASGTEPVLTDEETRAWGDLPRPGTEPLPFGPGVPTGWGSRPRPVQKG